MGKITLVTGGSRGGKSAHALRLAEALGAPRLFIATCPIVDEEMAERIRRHQAARGDGWDVLEEPHDLESAVRRAKEYRVAVVDCLTLWVNNLMYEAEQRGDEIDEDQVSALSADVAEACRQVDSRFILVTNEVGWGIVPENAMARRYRDLVGRCNQVLANLADSVVLCVSGIPISIKQESATR